MSNKEELISVVNELLERIGSVADVADKLWEGQNIGPDIRKCGEVIKRNIALITEDNDETSLSSLAKKNCATTFRHLEGMTPDFLHSLRGEDIKLLEVLTTHARDLFEILLPYQNEETTEEWADK